MLLRILKAQHFKNERGYLSRIIEEINGYIEGPLHLAGHRLGFRGGPAVLSNRGYFNTIFAGLRLELFLMTLFLV